MIAMFFSEPQAVTRLSKAQAATFSTAETALMNMSLQAVRQIICSSQTAMAATQQAT